MEANRIDEESSIDTIYELSWNAVRCKDHPVNTITANWIFVLRFKDYAGNVEMLGVLQGFIYPSLQHFWAHLNLLVLRFEPCTLRLDRFEILTFWVYLFAGGILATVYVEPPL